MKRFWFKSRVPLRTKLQQQGRNISAGLWCIVVPGHDDGKYMCIFRRHCSVELPCKWEPS